MDSTTTLTTHTRKPRLIAALLLVVAFVAGSLQLVSAPSAEAAVNRIAEADRFQTNTAVSRAYPSQAGGTVFIADGTKFPDALAAGPVAAAENARLLLSMPTSMQPTTRTELQRLRPARIVILGGTASISENVVAEARSLVPGAEITRIAGADRIDTSALIAERMASSRTTAAFVATGANFPDALAASSVGARINAPILLTVGASEQFRQSLARLTATAPNIRNIYVAGGPTSVPEAVLTQIRQTLPGVTVTRLAGPDRFTTSVEINRPFATPNVSRAILVDGGNFPDALSAATYSAYTGAPVLLTYSQCASGPEVRNFAQQRGYRDTTVIGGPNSVSQLAANMQPCPPPVNPGAVVSEIVGHTNWYRNANGVGSLNRHGSIDQIAQNWANWMAQNNSMVHSTTFVQQLQAIGCTRMGENIARTGRADSRQVVDMWYNSAGHKANMLNANFNYIGFGMAQSPTTGQWYYVQNFARC